MELQGGPYDGKILKSPNQLLPSLHCFVPPDNPCKYVYSHTDDNGKRIMIYQEA